MGLSSLGQQLIFPALASQIRGLRPGWLAESEGRGGQLEPGSAKRRGERRNGRGGLQFQRQICSVGRPGEVSERASERRCGGRPSRSSRSRWVLSRTGMIYRRSPVAVFGRTWGSGRAHMQANSFPFHDACDTEYLLDAGLAISVREVPRPH